MAIDSITVKFVPGYGIVDSKVQASPFYGGTKQSDVFKEFSDCVDKFAKKYCGGELEGAGRPRGVYCDDVHVLEEPPKKVVFNGPATICVWPDGTKTVVKCSSDDEYDERAGLAACMLKHAYGNAYLKAFDKWLGEGSQPHSTSDECDLDYFDTNQADECRRKFAQLLESLRNDPHVLS